MQWSQPGEEWAKNILGLEGSIKWKAVGSMWKAGMLHVARGQQAGRSQDIKGPTQTVVQSLDFVQDAVEGFS